ncbi:hypothetical protein ARMGADRAFT_1093166 [Armillaria gallica]|uniref:Uncharacterized protein n=1 Tax=Armillaria gallica TaxID=47427 RepID=A0A2H3CLY7_ARMGA|nr:hypothetical protein ARMGADRAFT_1093166 [Armillaria gallica]
MSTSVAQAIPSLVSLVKCADTVLQVPLEPNAQLLCLTTYFDEVVHVKCQIEAHYPSALKEEFIKMFKAVVDGCISKYNFCETWDTMLRIESDHLKFSVSGWYSISGNQILDALEVLPPLHYCIDDDIQMSSAPFTPNVTPSKEVQTAPLSLDATSASASQGADMALEEETPARETCAMSPSMVSSADWDVGGTGKMGREVSVPYSQRWRICTRETDLTTVFPNVANGGGEVVIMVDEPWGRISGGKPGDGDGMAAHDDWVIGTLGACHIRVPQPKKGGTHECRVTGELGAGSGGWGNSDTSMIVGTIVAPSNYSSMHNRAWSSSSSFIVGVLISILPSSSTSLALQCDPSMLSFHSTPPSGIPLDPQQSMIAPALIVVVVASFVFGSSSCIEMATDKESLDILHTLGVCRSHIRRRLAPISMWGKLGRSG